MTLPKLTVAGVVTKEHGETFADEWYDRSVATGAIVEAFARTGVVEWPDDPPAQMRVHSVETEITGRIFEALRHVAAEAFVRIAGEVLARERGRG